MRIGCGLAPPHPSRRAPRCPAPRTRSRPPGSESSSAAARPTPGRPRARTCPATQLSGPALKNVGKSQPARNSGRQTSSRIPALKIAGKSQSSQSPDHDNYVPEVVCADWRGQAAQATCDACRRWRRRHAPAFVLGVCHHGVIFLVAGQDGGRDVLDCLGIAHHRPQRASEVQRRVSCGNEDSARQASVTPRCC
jgi:hypothetical protein